MSQNNFPGTFITSSEDINFKCQQIKAILFDWDGVFNLGEKYENGSNFNESDGMGINMLRFSYYLNHHTNIKSAIITGEENPMANYYARREHMQAVYFKSKFKQKAFEHFCKNQNIEPHECAWFFDDILDFEVAKHAGLRFFINRNQSILLPEYIKTNHLADYMTHSFRFAVREACELFLHFIHDHNEVFVKRSTYSQEYQDYLNTRAETETLFYKFENSEYNLQP